MVHSPRPGISHPLKTRPPGRAPTARSRSQRHRPACGQSPREGPTHTEAIHGLAPSGRRVSNPRPSAWEADALPTELRPRDPDGPSSGEAILYRRGRLRLGLMSGASGNSRRGDLVTSQTGNVACVELEGISETTLWTSTSAHPSRARGLRASRPDGGRLRVRGAVRGVGGLGAVAGPRARTFDREVRRFLHDHPDGTVVALGEGGGGP